MFDISFLILHAAFLVWSK